MLLKQCPFPALASTPMPNFPAASLNQRAFLRHKSWTGSAGSRGTPPAGTGLR
jgi:hypothetical protein